jgi:hypothetical protein
MAFGNVMPSPVFTGLDNAGDIVPGGKLYSYAAGTTTPQNTYTSSALTTANPNPVILNAYGRAIVFCDLSLSYKFVLKNASNVTLWTVDNTVTALPSGSITLAMLANLAQDQFIGRVTASTGVPETATITAAARTVLDDVTVSAMVDTLGGTPATGTGAIVRALNPAFTGQPTTVIGTGTGAAATIGGTLDSQYTATNGGAGVSLGLITYTLKANTINANGRGLKITAWGTYTNTVLANAIAIGAFTIANYAGTPAAGGWRMEIDVSRTASNRATYSTSNSTISTQAITAGTFSAIDWTIDNIISLNTTCVALGDVVFYGWTIRAY